MEKDIDFANTPICQSCGMPLTLPEQFGKNADGTANGDYCVYCCPDGEANMRGTLDEIPDEKAARNALAQYLPTLKRWRA